MLGRADEIRSWGSYTNVPLTPGEEPTALPNPVVLAERPVASALRRVLRRARDGVALNVDEAAIAMTARGEDLADLCASAARVRDAGLESAGRRGPQRPAAGQLLAQGVHPGHPSVPRHLPLLHLRHGAGQAARRRARACTWSPTRFSTSPAAAPNWVARKRLFTLGDRPEARWAEARQWLDERGYDSTLDYVRAMAIRVLEETGLLPHLNPGVMSWSELSRLKPVAPSMGMMLETTSRRLFETKGLAHYGSPDKDPDGPAAHAGRRGPVVDPVHHRPAGRHRRDARRARRDHPRDPQARTRSSATSRK